MDQKVLLHGCGTALVTPFDKDGEIDYEAFAALVDRQVAGGVDFLVPLGTTGETPALKDKEKVELLRLTKEHCDVHNFGTFGMINKNRIPVHCKKRSDRTIDSSRH